MRRFFRPETFVFFLIFFTFMIGGRSRLFRDPGTFSHITFGQHMLSSAHLIRTDYFSFTANGEPWIAQQWIAECIMAIVHKLAGLDGLLVLTVAAMAFLYAWVARRLIHKGIHPLLSMLIIAVALAASTHTFHVRPHMASILFLGFMFSRLCNFEVGRASLRSLFWFIPLCALWTNIHGGVLGGLGTIALTFFGWSFFRIIGQKSPIKTYKEMIILSCLLGACVPTILINPYGLDMPRAWLSIIQSPVIPEIIQEHGSLIKTDAWMILAFGIFYIVSLIGTFPKCPRATWLIPLVWFVLSCSRVRHGPLFAITAAVAMADMFPHVRWGKWLSRKGSEICRIKPFDYVQNRNSILPWTIPLAIILGMLVYVSFSESTLHSGQGWAKLNPQHWPTELIPELKKYEKARPAGTPIFNDMLLGGFLIHFTPGLRVFIDDRCELYGDDRLLAYVHAEPSQFEEWAQRYRFDIALTKSGSSFDRYLKKNTGWRVVKQGSAATLFRRSETNISPTSKDPAKNRSQT
jgi:hypothetical protein